MGAVFRLTAYDGSTYVREDALGMVVGMAFGYADCSDVCTMMLARMADAPHSWDRSPRACCEQ